MRSAYMAATGCDGCGLDVAWYSDVEQVGACGLRQSEPQFRSSSVNVVCQTSPRTAFKCRTTASTCPLALPVYPPRLWAGRADRKVGGSFLAGPAEPLATLPSGVSTACPVPACPPWDGGTGGRGQAPPLSYVERPLGAEGFEQLTQGREVMKSQVRRQGSCVVGDSLYASFAANASVLTRRGKGFSEALDERIQEALQIDRRCAFADLTTGRSRTSIPRDLWHQDGLVGIRVEQEKQVAPMWT